MQRSFKLSVSLPMSRSTDRVKLSKTLSMDRVLRLIYLTVGLGS
ncbi:hypothetical protein [Leptospira noguchii]|nr:hypothetical protein [Leptospira noguchii]